VTDNYDNPKPSTRARTTTYGHCETDCQSRPVSIYGFDSLGRALKAPEGWEIVPEGERMVSGYLDYAIDVSGGEDHGWSPTWRPRTLNTMMPIFAKLWGNLRAFARPTPAHKDFQRLP
jgi:hypothetical protein